MKGKTKPQPTEQQLALDALVRDQEWVDRISMEVRAARQWSDKWARLVDAQIYGGSQDAASRGIRTTPLKARTTKWSYYSNLSAPGAHVQLPEPREDPGKVTGPRHHYRTAGVPGNPVRLDVGTSSSATISVTGTKPKTAATLPATISTAETIDAQTQAVLHVRESRTTREAKQSMMARGPQGLYRFPPTNTMEYGWRWCQERDSLHQGPALQRRG